MSRRAARAPAPSYPSRFVEAPDGRSLMVVSGRWGTTAPAKGHWWDNLDAFPGFDVDSLIATAAVLGVWGPVWCLAYVVRLAIGRPRRRYEVRVVEGQRSVFRAGVRSVDEIPDAVGDLATALKTGAKTVKRVRHN
jgi:hypothetical protein